MVLSPLFPSFHAFFLSMIIFAPRFARLLPTVVSDKPHLSLPFLPPTLDGWWNLTYYELLTGWLPQGTVNYLIFRIILSSSPFIPPFLPFFPPDAAVIQLSYCSASYFYGRIISSPCPFFLSFFLPLLLLPPSLLYHRSISISISIIDHQSFDQSFPIWFIQPFHPFFLFDSPLLL